LLFRKKFDNIKTMADIDLKISELKEKLHQLVERL